MTNKNTTSNQERCPAEQKLEHWYGHIGISAVVAALRFATCGKHTGKGPAPSHGEEEKRTQDIAA
jgi:hypothetical protein